MKIKLNVLMMATTIILLMKETLLESQPSSVLKNQMATKLGPKKPKIRALQNEWDQMPSSTMPKFKFEKINALKGTSGTQDSYYFEFSINRIFIQEIASRMGVPTIIDIENNGQDSEMGSENYGKYGKLQMSVLFPQEFQFWRENLAKVFWGRNSLEKIKEMNVDQSGELNNQPTPQLEYEASKTREIPEILSKNRIVSFDIMQYLLPARNQLQEEESKTYNTEDLMFFGFTIHGVDNPPQEGYIDLFEVTIDIKPTLNSKKDKNQNIQAEQPEDHQVELKNKKIKWKGVEISTRSMIKHGQKVFLRKNLKEILIINPFVEYCPGFYSSDIQVELSSGSTYKIKIVPVSDDPEIDFEPKELIFNPIDYLIAQEETKHHRKSGENNFDEKDSEDPTSSKNESKDIQLLLPNDKVVQNYQNKLFGSLTKKFRIKIGRNAKLGPHRIRFKKIEFNSYEKNSNNGKGNNNYADIQVMQFKVSLPPPQMSSAPPRKYNGERPYLRFREKHFAVPFEGISFPVQINLSHAPTERLKLSLRTVRPSQKGLIEIKEPSIYIEEGEMSSTFFVTSTLGAASGMIEATIVDKEYRKHVKITRKFINMDVVDFDTFNPEINKIEIDGVSVIEDEVFIHSGQQNIRRDKEKVDRKVKLFDPERNESRTQEIFFGKIYKNFFRNKLLETKEDEDLATEGRRIFDSPRKNSKGKVQKEIAMHEIKNSIKMYFSKKTKVYAVVLKFPVASYPKYQDLEKLIDEFCHRSEAEVIDFEEESIRIVKKSTNFRNQEYGFVAEFSTDELNFSKQFDSKVIFFTEDRSHEKLMIDFKGKYTGKDTLQVYKLSFTIQPDRITPDHLRNLVSLYLNVHPRFLEIHDQGVNLSTNTQTISLYFFTDEDSSPEYLEQLHKNLQGFFQSQLLKLMLYNTKPIVQNLRPTGKVEPINTQLALFESPVIVRSVISMQNVAHKSVLTLVQSSKSTLLLNLKAMHDDPNMLKFVNSQAVVGLKNRFSKIEEQIRMMNYAGNDQKQILYDGLDEMKDWIVKSKTCVKFHHLGRCGHNVSKLLAVTQDMMFVEGRKSHSKILTLGSWICTILLLNLLQDTTDVLN